MNLYSTLFKSSALALPACIDRMIRFDSLSWTTVVRRWVFISLRQLNDLSDSTDVTGIVHAILRSRFSSKKASSYFDTKIERARAYFLQIQAWSFLMSCARSSASFDVTLAISRFRLTGNVRSVA